MEKLVHDALDSAVHENGYHSLMKQSNYAVALDLMEYCSDFADNYPEELEPHIQSWRNKQ